jgi:putative endonuclease
VEDQVSTVVSEPEAAQATWWLYLLACSDGRTYAGVALNVAARFQLHVEGKGAKFTRSNPPLAILGAQPFPDKSSALQAEYALKQLDRVAKLDWATHWPYSGDQDMVRM